MPQRVFDEVRQRLAEPSRIDGDTRKRRGGVDRESHSSLGGLGPKFGGYLLKQSDGRGW